METLTENQAEKIKTLKNGISYFMKEATSAQKRNRGSKLGTAIMYNMIDSRLRDALTRQEYLVGFHFGLIGNNGHKGSIITNADNIAL